MLLDKAKKRGPLLRRALIFSSFGVAALLGAISGVLFAYSPDLPEISELDSYTPGTMTRLYDRNNILIGEFATERRLIIGYEDIPPDLRPAIIAAAANLSAILGAN